MEGRRIKMMPVMKELNEIFRFRKDKNLKEYLDISCGDRVYWKRFEGFFAEHGYCFKVLNGVKYYWKGEFLK